MISQISIIQQKDLPENQKGEIFEELIAKILQYHRYKVLKRVNTTGMEIDLIGEHKDRPRETVFCECKAKTSLSAEDIQTFMFKVAYNEADSGYFFSTTEFTHHVAGLINDIKEKENYQNIVFFEPEKIITIFKETGIINEPYISDEIKDKITKQIFVWSYAGKFLLYIVSNSTFPTNFMAFNADNRETVKDSLILEILKKNITDIESLEQIHSNHPELITDNKVTQTIAEVVSSSNWYELLPAEGDNFVGREDELKNFADFISDVKSKRTNKRIFYIEGKSGWGKSSLVSQIRNLYTLNNNALVYAVDCRSIQSSNFAVLAFDRLIKKTFESNFIQQDLFFSTDIKISSSNDILSSESMKALLKKLEQEHKVMILIFDQFEDIFLKSQYYKTFYKLLTDTNEAQSNLVVGFSWKSEISIPLGEAYALWHQAKDSAFQIQVNEFSNMEVKAIIKQLEQSLKNKDKLNLPLKRKLQENSQGYPWLVKKLTRHVYDLYNSGKSINEISREDMNIKELFESDLEKLTTEEVRSLRYIATQADVGESFDASQIGEILDGNIVTSLVNKRLIVKTGTKFNIYWDIFRDYLVTNEVPKIGDSFIIRLTPKPCLAVYKLLKKDKFTPISEINLSLPKLGKGTLDNILRELMDMDIVQKDSIKDEYRLSVDAKPTEKDFINSLTERFKSYTPYTTIERESKGEKITKSQVIQIFKRIFASTNYTDSTWGAYVNTLISWLKYLELPLYKNIDVEFSKNTYLDKYELSISKPEEARFSKYPKEIESQIKLLQKDASQIDNLDNATKLDLALLDLIKLEDGKFTLTENGNKIIHLNDDKELKMLLSEKLKTVPIIKKVLSLYSESPINTRDLVIQIPNVFNLNESAKLNYIVANIQNNWAEYAFYNSQGINVNQTKIPYYPEAVLRLFNRLIDEKHIEITNTNIRQLLNSIVYLDLIDNANSQNLTSIGEEISKCESINKRKLIAIQALRLVKIKRVYDAYLEVKNEHIWTYKDVMQIKGLLNESNSESTCKLQASFILKWVEFIIKSKSNENY